ncbi:MAG: tetratricopeptide repeat protein [Acidobacteria bacterium]|nr:tetratricopeptide repeat protein [Acidobacteriota bacterium]
MRDYRSLILIAIILTAGAASPAAGEKELIIKLQGEVVVIQRQLRDLQESFDKWQGQSTSSIQKLSDNSTTTLRGITGIEDALRTTQSSQTTGLAGASSQLQKIIDQLNRQAQSNSQIGQQISGLRKELSDYQQKMESRDKPDKIGENSLPNDDPDALYLAAHNNFNSRSYQNTIRYANQFLSLAGTGAEKRADVRFLLGESLYALGRDSDAVIEFDQVIAQYPDSEKTGNAIFRKGLCLLRLEKREDGISTLKTVIIRYPKSMAAENAKKELSRLGENY